MATLHHDWMPGLSAIVATLGEDGMSSGESEGEHDERSPRRLTRTKSWRHPDHVDHLRRLDMMINQTRQEGETGMGMGGRKDVMAQETDKGTRTVNNSLSLAPMPGSSPLRLPYRVVVHPRTGQDKGREEGVEERKVEWTHSSLDWRLGEEQHETNWGSMNAVLMRGEGGTGDPVLGHFRAQVVVIPRSCHGRGEEEEEDKQSVVGLWSGCRKAPKLIKPPKATVGVRDSTATLRLAEYDHHRDHFVAGLVREIWYFPLVLLRRPSRSVEAREREPPT
ncbi:hypothetical protein FA13DRAFT_1712687 [Coprinellus micaceus]|uniref:Uncharacterized protein n=1 Tax=Coprinellus micaceus TaxID=71717 RepID=A0A4Y7T081_COPMI|nr:hypothetical protein FA13DRAFT_1712687 [Coprinellus micaceus]